MEREIAAPIKVFWQPGCTSCLRTKEFLSKHNVPFVSVNVLEDGFQDLERFGLRQVPIVIRGDQWVNGQVLADVARIAGIQVGNVTVFPPPELFWRLCRIQKAARRYLQQISDNKLGQLLPNRPRSYAQLVYHILNIADAFLEHERGIPLEYEAYNRVPAPGQDSKAALTAYGDEIYAGLERWWREGGAQKDFNQRAQVYYGEQTLRDFLERTTWHSGQHLRQLMLVLQTIGVTPREPLGTETFEGLPMPEKVWDDEKPLD